jgi:hypothetical protein
VFPAIQCHLYVPDLLLDYRTFFMKCTRRRAGQIHWPAVQCDCVVATRLSSIGFPRRRVTFLTDRSELNRLETGELDVAVQACHAHFVATRFWEVEPADGELLVVVRRVLLVLNMLAAFDGHSQNQSSFTGIQRLSSGGSLRRQPSNVGEVRSTGLAIFIKQVRR